MNGSVNKLIIDFKYLKALYNLKISGVIHVGAHYGEEIPLYQSFDIDKIVCFEPVSKNFNILKQYESENVKLYNLALGDHEDENIMMYLSSNNYESSSLLQPAEHLIDHSDVSFTEYEFVNISTLDNFYNEVNKCNYLSIDVQGYEYEVLRGAEKTLHNIDYIYMEVNRAETYKNNHLVGDIDRLLDTYNFDRVKTEWASRTWGDAFYLKRS
jgi:FkbM family methyltransferase